MKDMIYKSEVPRKASAATVLLVEDDEDVRRWGYSALRRLGYSVLQAKDGVEALNMFIEHKDEISCLFCDLSMPRMNGWKTIAAIRAIRQDLPVVLTSGYDRDSVMFGFHTELPDLFLDKPYGINELGGMIGQAMSHKVAA